MLQHFKSKQIFFFTYSLYGAQKKGRQTFHTANNPHVSYHIPACDEIWYECPYLKLGGKLKFRFVSVSQTSYDSKGLKNAACK
jgi:hypothetical protein